MTPFEKHGLNGDRLYFTDGNCFIKYDLDIKRGRHEAAMMHTLTHPAIPSLYEFGLRRVGRKDYHMLRMRKMPGIPLEDMQVPAVDRPLIAMQLFEFFNYCQRIGIVHGDINVSNVLWNGRSISVIDLERARPFNYTAPKEEAFFDLYGPPWGIFDLLRKI
jgi:RIO-like serine/threonine protein kinase